MHLLSTQGKGVPGRGNSLPKGSEARVKQSQMGRSAGVRVAAGGVGEGSEQVDFQGPSQEFGLFPKNAGEPLEGL